MKLLSELIEFFYGKREKWKPESKGQILIHSFVYEIRPVEIQGTYVREVNQNGEDRFWITEPGGTPYLGDNSRISPVKVNSPTTKPPQT